MKLDPVVGHAADADTPTRSWARAYLAPPLAAATAGALEVAIWHPWDTTSKRLMSHERRVVDIRSPRLTLQRLQAVILGDAAAPTARAAVAGGAAAADTAATSKLQPAAVLRSLYRGTQWAICYKVSQRVVKFAGQPLLRDVLRDRGVGDRMIAACGKKPGKVLLESTSGAVVGSMEIVLLPFDRMKVLSQTNAAALKNRGMLAVIRQEGLMPLYAGAGVVLVRNIPGSFALFWGTAIVKDYVFQLDDYRSASLLQNIAASSAGATLGVVITSPMDVIKTRIQNKDIGGTDRGMQVLARTIKNEGFGAFYKGITPKIFSVGPRLHLHRHGASDRVDPRRVWRRGATPLIVDGDWW